MRTRSDLLHYYCFYHDAYNFSQSPLSIVVVDDLEYILDWVAVGPRFSNVVLSNLRSMLTKRPPKNRRRFVLATTAERSVLDQLNILERIFTHQIAVPNIGSANELGRVLSESGVLQPGDVQRTVELIHQSTGGQQFGVGVKRVLEAVKIAKEGRDPAERCAEILSELMIRSV
jgi:vesicle-fusing ATPase